jgi:uncharacterized protein YbaP (TraB family)
LINQTVLAESSVWKVEKNGRQIYLGGTIHLLTKADYPLPGEFDLAYNQSQVVYFETDIELLKKPKSSASMLKALKSKTGKTLDQVLQRNTLIALRAFLKQRQLSLDAFNHLSPSGLYLTLMTMEFARNDLVGVGVDEHFSKRARIDNKKQMKFETMQQHLSFLSKTAGGSGDQLILNGIKDMKNLSTMVPDLKRIWRSGDREKFQTHLLNPYMKFYPTAYHALIVQRNNNWMPIIEGFFKTPEVELVLVGALHMIGRNGLLQRLEAMGYKVEPL